MSNPAMPNLPGFGAIAESMEMVSKMWGGSGVSGIGFPSMTTPSLSVEDIGKQIADLKAVEAWLTLNMNMLRGTIQALEVQRATISAVKSMGEAFKNAGKAATVAGKPSGGFSFPFAYMGQSAQSEQSQASPTVPSPQANAAQPASLDIGASLVDAGAWWNMLQSQFKQAVTAATVSTTSTPSNAASDTSNDDAAKAGVPIRHPIEPTADQLGSKLQNQAKNDASNLSSTADSANATGITKPTSRAAPATKRTTKATPKPPVS